MKAEHVTPTVQAMVDMLETMLKVKPQNGSPTARSSIVTAHPINVVSQLFGDVAGHLVWGMSVITADKIAARMTGQPVVTFDKSAAQAISELGALINAQTIRYLERVGMDCSISNAMIVKGSTNRAGLPSTPTLVFPLMIEDFGSIELSVSTFSQARLAAVA